MAQKPVRLIIILSFILTIGVIGALVFRPEVFFRPQGPARKQTRHIIPQRPPVDGVEGAGSAAEQMAWEDGMNAKVALDDGEILVSVLTADLDGDLQEEQIIAYRNLGETDSPIYITYIDFDTETGGYKRFWSAPTAATRPGTISLSTQDLIGDRSLCIIVTGMNGEGEHTMAVFRRPSNPGSSHFGSTNQGLSNQSVLAFVKIADLKIDGSITIQETERTQAYQLGLTGGTSFPLAAYGRDSATDNILDQVETIYTYNPVRGRYEQSRLTRIPGSQIEQRRVRDLLNGGAAEFEAFISGLWYYVSPQGTLDNRQYIYFDPLNRELIFFVDETQQVFIWQHSTPTRYGLYISSQNISVSTLRRFINIELESLDSIRVRVQEDVRLPINVSDSWDGSYRKAGAESRTAAARTVTPYLDAAYDGSIGKLTLDKNGSYELYTEGNVRKGNYAFFMLDNYEMLELRPGTISGLARETYLVERQSLTAETGSPDNAPEPTGGLTLSRVRLSTKGFQEVHEAAIRLIPAADNGS
ncbi:hypothetical protein FACS1894124_5420 [Spirochaetia bacterium]|nr:hypothetical protein FACS1894124_5420 [Spirochaetia bacterium]